MEDERNMIVRPVGVLRTSKAGKAHIHKVIIEACGGNVIPYIICANIVLLYNPNLSVEKLVATIEVLQAQIKLRVKSK